MWKPADNLNWQSDATCAKPSNRYALDWFFSKDFKEKYAAKNMCFTCPVRSECLQWALEHRQIWGIWGGRDEVDIRRTLSVSYNGEEARRRRFPNCPYCTARPSKLSVSVEQLPNGGRWTTAKVVECTECGFSWRSRTSANAVEAYNLEKNEKQKKKTNKKTKP
jgi:WhiB family transcriptional regulator, redox-sensing transcriptional regulator